MVKPAIRVNVSPEIYEFALQQVRIRGFRSLSDYGNFLIMKDRERVLSKMTESAAASASSSGGAGGSVARSESEEEELEAVVEEIGVLAENYNNKVEHIKQIHQMINKKHQKNFEKTKEGIDALSRLLIEWIWEHNGVYRTKMGKVIGLNKQHVQTYVRLLRLILRKEELLSRIRMKQKEEREREKTNNNKNKEEEEREVGAEKEPATPAVVPAPLSV
jgi:hypothetical protein